MNAPDHQLSPEGRFVIRNYGSKKPFSNFLPGISGVYGTPMWVFTVNRGQGVVSFGTRNKDNAMLEFYPANKAYQMATSHGFRTFLKTKGEGASHTGFYEPFRHNRENHAEQAMDIASYELGLREKNTVTGVETTVNYFTLPGEPIAALVRELTITNISSRAMDVELLDGLPQVNPYGMNEFFIKNMSRTIEAWMGAENIAKKAPFLRLKVDATDRPEVTFIEGGNFFFALEDGGKMLECFVDPAAVFGSSLDFSEPQAFLDDSLDADSQILENRTPCAFTQSHFRLSPGRSKKIWGVYGHARSIDILNKYLSRARRAGYFAAKREENRRLVESVKAPVFTVTSSTAYDHYCGQTYLDNVLRGGLPLCLGPKDDPFAFYVYSRKHGDLERDYNNFLVEDSYFSQGNGNFRDVNQNRRCDVWFEPRVGTSNIRTFLNLLQLDGFNPLVVKGTELRFKKNAAAVKALNKALGAKNAKSALEQMKKSFKLGELYRALESRKATTPAGFEKLLGELAPYLEREEKADHGEGFWVDHWTYDLDLIESYRAVHPENLRGLMLGDKGYTFFDNDHRVRPREEKYFLLPGRGVRQYQSVVKDKEKAALIASRTDDANVVRSRQGKGPVYRTTLLAKLVCLVANKFASLDPEGVGIEAEADKPSWYDALNGLPGLPGSSLPETFELKRLILFLIQTLDELRPEAGETVALPVEMADFVQGLDSLLERHMRDKFRSKHFEFWDEATTLKEKYRAKIIFGVSGTERALPLERLRSMLERSREKVEIGLQKVAQGGLYPTYFENKVTRHKTIGKTGRVKPLAFEQKPLPLFLEGLVHAMKVEKDPAKRRAIHRAVRQSALYDTRLGMYKVNAPLKEASYEVGRARVFTPGWLENESIWLHMEYKYLLELLKGGLQEDFFQDMKKAMVPFQPAERYGRSILENSSFIVSSVFPDASLHGTGFVARLSGSTAEFLNIWLLMNVGKKPFVLSPDGSLSLRFEPMLPSWLFTQKETTRTYTDKSGEEKSLRVPKDSVAFLFLGKTLVVYRNPRGLDTFGKSRASVKMIKFRDRGRAMEFRGDTIPAPYSLKVRDGLISRIDIELG